MLLEAHALMYTSWSEVWRGMVKILDMSRMHGHSRGSMEVKMMKSIVEHDSAGMRCLASVKFGNKLMAGYYSGIPM